MNQLFDCPDCSRTHDEPADAAYVLAMRCLDCELEAQLRDVRRKAALLAASPATGLPAAASIRAA
jgi:hypothetical protein